METLPKKPEDAFWTDEQWRAIMTRGQTTLVAAAAGSGKTAVLVERIIQRLLSEQDPVDVDRLLVVTFTNAAAAEMRQRIGEALEEALAEQPRNEHLQRQLSLLNRASISTLHAFCIEVLRSHYYRIGLDPGFRILDETEAVLMREEVLEQLFEEQYSDPDNEAFFNLVDAYSGDRSDEDLQRLVERLYDFSRSHPWPEEWLDEVSARYRHTDPESAWIAELRQEIGHELEESLTLLKEAERLIALPSGPVPYGEAVKHDMQQLKQLIEATADWDSLYEAFQQITFPRLKSIRKEMDISETLKESVKDLRDTAKKNVETLKKEYFLQPLATYLHDLEEMAPLIETLIELVKAFTEHFAAAKREKALLDYDDLEHTCLQILLAEGSTSERIVPSEVALEYKETFREVLVDEYQDTNLVQETIIQLVSQEDNLFMVGDVKQSIYRFRLAEPTLFLQKYKDFSPSGNEAGLRIDLAKNFRSREEVLNSTNFIFRQIMDETVGELDYDEAAELTYGFPYPESDSCATEFIVLDRTGQEDEELPEEVEEAAREELEARFIADKIKKLLRGPSGQRAQVYDTKRKKMRPVTYRDIVILMRSTRNSAGMVMEELKKQGIPAYIEMSSGYFEATEVATMMSLLQIIDNPDQDIPLASVLRSPIVGLTEEQLARIRIANKKGSFLTALLTYIETHETGELASQLRTFYAKLEQWRTAARQGALSDLIWQLYRDTKYYDFVGGLPGGVQRQANLRALYDRARQYENTSFRGLFRFLRFVERMKGLKQDLGTARALSEQEDVVRIMTIHSSKGLEFPFVFLAGLSKRFNMQDLSDDVLFHKHYGIGTKYIDPEERIAYPTLLRHAIKRQMHKELLAEEMRVLYVAMTRAREKLYLIGTVRGAERHIQRWQIHLNDTDWLLQNYARRNSRTFLDLIGPALIRHRDSKGLREFFTEKEVRAAEVFTDPSRWTITVVPPEDLVMTGDAEKQDDEEKLARIERRERVDVKEKMKEAVYERLTWTYDNRKLTEIKAKQTVTELKRLREVIDERSTQQYAASFQPLTSERPRFLQKTQMTAAERGTAMHTFMQHLPFTDVTMAMLEELRAKLRMKEILTEEQAEAIDLKRVYTFSQTELFARMKRADEAYREIPFTYAVPALEHRDEKVIVQGVIDLVLQEGDDLILIDYKTDALPGRDPSMTEVERIMRQRYKSQIDMYAQALQDIWQKNVTEKYLYLFANNHVLAIE